MKPHNAMKSRTKAATAILVAAQLTMMPKAHALDFNVQTSNGKVIPDNVLGITGTFTPETTPVTISPDVYTPVEGYALDVVVGILNLTIPNGIRDGLPITESYTYDISIGGNPPITITSGVTITYVSTEGVPDEYSLDFLPQSLGAVTIGDYTVSGFKVNQIEGTNSGLSSHELYATFESIPVNFQGGATIPTVGSVIALGVMRKVRNHKKV